ncbi:MAG: PHP-associated domain-containing protein [Bacilli bacterium]
MRIDFHSHAKLTKKSTFRMEHFVDMLTMAAHEGLDAVCITEHFNTLAFEDVYDTLDQHFTYKGHYYEVAGVKAFSGMEVDVARGGHILVTGHRDNIRTVRAALAPHTEEGAFIELEALLALAKANELMVIGAHPFRESNSLFQHDASLLQQLDAFDLNGKDLYTYGPEAMEGRVRELAAEIGIPVVTGSDAHYPVQYGCVHTVLERDCETAEEIRTLIANGQFTTHVSPALSTKVFAAKTTKSVLKQKLGV